MKKVQLSIGVDKRTKEKLCYIAKCEDRTVSGQANYILQRYIRQYEKENGKIDVQD